MSARDLLLRDVGFVPTNPLAWLYAARGYYKIKEYHRAIDCLSFSLRHDRTKKDAHHLLAFSLQNTNQTESAIKCFIKSVNFGNDTDWQCLVELLLKN